MKWRRFLAGLMLGWLVIGTGIYFATDGWEGSGLTGLIIGCLLGWLNVDRAEQPWSEYVKEQLRIRH